jgi:hypothetical protein
MAMRVRWRLVCLLGTWIGALPVALVGCTGHSNGKPADAGEEFAPVADARLDGSDERSALADSAALPDGDVDAATCHPGSVSGFHPPLFAPSHRSPACNGFNADGGLVQAYGEACIGHMATYDTCASLTVPDAAGAEACFHCLVTAETPDASEYGPVVIVTVPLPNYAGCIQLLDPTEAGASCAQAFTSAANCADYVCRSVCPPVDQPSIRQYNACWNEATSGACAGYWLTLESCMVAETGDGGTPVGIGCFGGGSVEGNYLLIAKLMCVAN